MDESCGERPANNELAKLAKKDRKTKRTGETFLTKPQACKTFSADLLLSLCFVPDLHVAGCI